MMMNPTTILTLHALPFLSLSHIIILLQELDISHNAFRAMPPIISLLLTCITKVALESSNFELE